MGVGDWIDILKYVPYYILRNIPCLSYFVCQYFSMLVLGITYSKLKSVFDRA
ncbi:MAG: hypothetical protein FD159_367 [Syntrophaceae bacterium]|nr:MAG: hypothetical protein FD159_367 [Syntrophaceae bacterium]